MGDVVGDGFGIFMPIDYWGFGTDGMQHADAIQSTFVPEKLWDYLEQVRAIRSYDVPGLSMLVENLAGAGQDNAALWESLRLQGDATYVLRNGVLSNVFLNLEGGGVYKISLKGKPAYNTVQPIHDALGLEISSRPRGRLVEYGLSVHGAVARLFDSRSHGNGYSSDIYFSLGQPVPVERVQSPRLYNTAHGGLGL